MESLQIKGGIKLETLFIYDNNGVIFDYKTGNYTVPVGLQHIIDTMPENSFPIKVNVENEIHFVEYGQHPRNKLDEIEELVSEQEAALMEIAEMIMNLQGNGGNE